MELQPVVEVPLFQKTSKKVSLRHTYKHILLYRLNSLIHLPIYIIQERPDRLEGSIATDEDFLSFCAAIDAPPTVSVSP